MVTRDMMVKDCYGMFKDLLGLNGKAKLSMENFPNHKRTLFVNLPFDLQQLRYFLVVAEEENIGRAAVRLNITASPLSRRIRELEARLDLQLFLHGKKRVSLTRAGHAFSKEVSAFLAQAEELKGRISDIRTGADQTVHIGYVQGAMAGGLLPNVISKVKTNDCDVQFRLHPMRSREQINAIRRGAIELALVHTPPTDTQDLEIVLLEQDPFNLVVRHDNSNLKVTSATELSKHNWITLDENSSPTFRREFLNACRQIGFEPDIRHQTKNIAELLGLVESGLGIGILQSKLSRASPSGVKFIPFPNFPLAVKIYGVYRAGMVSETTNRILEIALNLNTPPGTQA